MMTKTVEEFFQIGCGRCSLVGTPECKVHTWQEPLRTLRQFVLDTGLTEESKWGYPCYTYDGKNVVMMAAWKDSISLSFFKGTLLEDAENLLVKPGENSQVVKLFKFRTMDELLPLEQTIKAYIFEAIEIEKAGLKVEVKPVSHLDYPEELEQAFQEDPFFQEAFENLTPGRQKGYLLQFNQPKNSATKVARIEKYKSWIMEGKGLHDDYKAQKK